NAKPSTRDVVIEGNVCANVDHQCLIASASERHSSGSLVFRNNICGNNGSQGVYLLDFPNAKILNNLFLPSIAFFGVAMRSGSANTLIANNIFLGSIGPYSADETSKSGLEADHNLIYNPAKKTLPEWYGWSEPNGSWGEDPMISNLQLWPPSASLRPLQLSPLVDAGSAASGDDTARDIAGNPRVVDGNGDGKAVIDIGPFEFNPQAEATQ
ncbi:MAG TPA: right-handed parallel beta-helix repeat-containing protein, partial [Bradyrhizobium sp.]|nr:right-handed parallel beta-helix repeat-containing protein [Bradyrhizobium sp.]